MPMQPPRFGARVRPRKPWEPSGADRRVRGRAGVSLRAQVRAEEPCSRICLAAGLMVRTEEIDHIVPLSEGGPGARSNLQGLCGPCHEAKSKSERAASATARAEARKW